VPSMCGWTGETIGREEIIGGDVGPTAILLRKSSRALVRNMSATMTTDTDATALTPEMIRTE
jgi:hypothetical protein